MIRKNQNISTILGVAFEHSRMHFALVRRSGQGFEVQKTFAVEISGSVTVGNALTLGQEIRQALQEHDVKERRCIVALPVQWALSLPTKLPELPEADIHEFLNLEAERNFAYDPGSLFVSSSRTRFANGDQYANVAGIQREHLVNVQTALQAAKLKPLSFTIGIAAIQRVAGRSAEPELILAVEEQSMEIAVTTGDGLFAMRALPMLQNDPAAEAEAVGREVRVTLGHIPAELRGRLVTARIFGRPGIVEKVRTAVAPRLRSLGMAAEVSESQWGGSPGAVAAAAGYLLGKRPDFEFLPPKVSAWKQFSGTTSARKLAWAASIAVLLVLGVISAFLIQGWQLSKLQNRWSSISPRVTELEDMQQQIKKFRPWFDISFRNLTILRKVTEAFPAEGVVTAKTLEVRNQSQVICSGVARDNQALFKMLDQLRSTKEVAEVKMDQIRGKNPLQFSFNFRWVEGGTGEH